MWKELTGYKRSVLAGASGTVNVPPGAIITSVLVHATAGGATATLLGDPSFPVVAGAPPTTIQNLHGAMQANASTGTACTFVNTDMYRIEYFTAGNA